MRGDILVSERKAEKVAVLGSGSWGTALAKVLVENGHDVVMWSRVEDQAIIDEINNDHTNKKYLQDLELPAELVATTDLEEAISGREIIVVVIPTVGIRSTAKQLNAIITYTKIIVHA